jgi:glycosyltransferase involved in cell wall biosynthesis
LRIAIATAQVPFIKGGAEALAASFRQELLAQGHECEIVSIPFKWYPPERVLDCMAIARLVDLTEVNGQRIDKVIGMKFPAYLLEHPNKTIWLMHQHRQAYELHGTEFGDLHKSEEGKVVAEEIKRWDNACFGEQAEVFTISKTVADRLQTYNGVKGTPLYPPPMNYKDYYPGKFGDYVLYPGRFSPMKRQRLLIEAIGKTKNPVKAVLIGSFSDPYGEEVLRTIKERNLTQKVRCRGLVDEKEKLELYANALAVYNGVLEEDYGYVTLEAFFAGKPVVTHSDSGGPLEFVRSEVNGFITEPSADLLAETLDTLYEDRAKAKDFGDSGRGLLNELHIDWETVITRLLG